MDYKEKLEEAKKLYAYANAAQKYVLESLFPELAGSEDEKIRKALVEMVHDTTGDELWVDYNIHKEEALAWLKKQGEQKPQRMISAEAKEAMYSKPADTVEQKCEESKTKVFDAPTPFEDKLYAFVAACEFLAIPSKIEFILEHSQEILDAAREQIGKEQSSTWSVEDEAVWAEISDLLWEGYKQSGSKFSWDDIRNWVNPKLKSLRPQNTWKPTDEQIEILDMVLTNESMDDNITRILRELKEQLKKLRGIKYGNKSRKN